MTSLLDRLARRLQKSGEPVRPVIVRALVVDDEEPIRVLIERILKMNGFQTAVARDGVDALAVAEGIEVLDILVTDLMMPNMNGDELARRLREKRPEVKVLYLTGYSDKLFADKMVLSDHEAFLDKPPSIEGLLQAVELLLTGHLRPTHPAERGGDPTGRAH